MISLGDYATPIADLFMELRGTSLLLSSADFELIRKWRDRGIPAHVVIRAIEELWAKKKPGTKVLSLYYVASAVEDEFHRWSRMLQ